MLTAAALAFINHLLAGEAWALARLRPFAGRTLRVCCPPLDIRLAIDAGGALRAAPKMDAGSAANEQGAAGESDPAADICLTLPPGALPSLAAQWLKSGGGNESAGIDLLAAARIEGAADLADTLAFVLRNLRWDVEDDLSRVVGDIAAHRLAQGGRALFSGAAHAARALTQNFAEYFSEDNSLLVGQTEMGALTQGIDALTRDAAALEQRLARLGGAEP